MAEIEVCDVCAENHGTESCPELGLDSEHVPVPVSSRARLTLPHFVQAFNLPGEEVGVFAQSLIAKKTQFGPYEAKKTTHEFNDDSLFILKITTKDGTSVSLDTTSESECNWMCLIRAASSEADQNCIAYQLSTSIFYSTTRDVQQGEELRVWYTPAYAKRIGKLPSPDPNCKVMLGMKVIYPSVEDLQDIQANQEPEKDAKINITEQNEENTKDTPVNDQEETFMKYSCKRCGRNCETEIELAKHIREHILPEVNRKRGPKSKMSPGRRSCGRPRKRRLSDQIDSVSKQRKAYEGEEEEESEENTMYLKEEVLDSDDEVTDKNFEPLLSIVTVKQEGSRVQPRRSLKGRRTTGYNADDNFESIFHSSLRLMKTDPETKMLNKCTEMKKAPTVEMKKTPTVNVKPTNNGVKRGRGRPRKIRPPACDVASSDTPVSEQKKPAGIQKKTDLSETDGSNSLDTEETEMPIALSGENQNEDQVKETSQEKELDGKDLTNAAKEGMKDIDVDNGHYVEVPSSENKEGASVKENDVTSINVLIDNHTGTTDQNSENLSTSDTLPSQDNDQQHMVVPCDQVNTTVQQTEDSQQAQSDHKVSNEQQSTVVSFEQQEEAISMMNIDVDPLQSILDELDKTSNAISMQTAEEVIDKNHTEIQMSTDAVENSHEQSRKPSSELDTNATDSTPMESVEGSNVTDSLEMNSLENSLEEKGQIDQENGDNEDVHLGKKPIDNKPGLVNDETVIIDHRNVKNYMLIVNGENGKEYVCKVCNKKFSLERYLRLHMPKHTNEYTCQTCGIHYTRKDSFRRHKCTMSDEEESSQDDEGELEGSTKEKPKKTSKSRKGFACDICSQSFSNEKYLFRHMAMHTDIFKCNKCSKCFSRKDSLQRHVLKCCPDKASEYQVFACSKCSKTFSTLLGQQNHESNCTKALCGNCNKVFDSDEVLRTHQLTCTTVQVPDELSTMKRFSCDECPKSFKNLSYLKQHKQLHTENNVCGLCDKKLKSGEEKEHHERFCFAQTVILKFGTVKCDECEDEFCNAKEYQNHYLIHTHPHSCSKCEKRFVKIGSLHTHVCPFESSESVFMCNICRREFRTGRALSRHSEIHQEKKYTCTHCHKKFHRRDYYNNHICMAGDGTVMKVNRADSPINAERLVCHVCGKNFVSSSNLNKHMKVHGEKKCVCPICNKKFHFVEYLKIHIQGFHEKKFQFQCTYCGKILTSKPGLISHTKLYHTDHREVYSCPTCHKEFSQKGNMKTHMYSHTKERSFQCPYCPKSFKYPDQLNRHKLLHTMTNKLKCDHCDKTFVKSYELKKHCQLFHSGMMYVCDVCGARCGHRHTMSRHYQRKHPGVAAMAKDVSFLDSLFRIVDNKEVTNVDHIQDDVQETHMPIGQAICTEEFLPQVAAQALHSLSGANLQSNGTSILTNDSTTAIMNADGTLSMPGQSGQTFSIQTVQQAIDGPDSQQTVVILQIINPQDQDIAGGSVLQQVQVQQVEAQIVDANEEDQEEIANVEGFVQDFVQVVEQEAEHIQVLDDQIVGKEEVSLPTAQ